MTAQVIIFLIGLVTGLMAYHLYAVAPSAPVDDTFHVLNIAKDDLYLRACILIREAEKLAAGTSGEYKRWTFVTQHLGREFPDRSDDFGVVIEAALRNKK